MTAFHQRLEFSLGGHIDRKRDYVPLEPFQCRGLGRSPHFWAYRVGACCGLSRGNSDASERSQQTKELHLAENSTLRRPWIGWTFMDDQDGAKASHLGQHPLLDSE
jgi:hypothetical protein